MSYLTIVATQNSTLIGTTFADNFEHQYSGYEVLKEFFLNSVLYRSQASKPKVAVYAAYNGSDYNEMQNTMNGFVSDGNITSYTLVDVDIGHPLDANLTTLKQYDVVVLDAAPDPDAGKFAVTNDTKTALSQYLKSGGRIVASAYIFVDWYDYVNWQRKLYNLNLTSLFGGATPNTTVYTASAISSAPFSTGENLTTYSVYHASYPNDPWFHYFWKLEVAAYGPTADFTEDKHFLKVNETVTFNASTSKPGFDGDDVCPIDNYTWDFGDGNITTVSTPIITHVYTNDGTYNVTLTVYAPGATPDNDTMTKLYEKTVFVGGHFVFLDKLSILAPQVGLASVLLAAAILSTVLIRRKAGEP